MDFNRSIFMLEQGGVITVSTVHLAPMLTMLACSLAVVEPKCVIHGCGCVGAAQLSATNFHFSGGLGRCIHLCSLHSERLLMSRTGPRLLVR
jgi:hypothetical protein